MEEDRTWSVTLTGKTLAGTDPQTVWQRTASMMKLDPDAFRERILDRVPLTLKSVSQSDAVRQRDAMKDCGADAVALDNPSGRYLWLQLDNKVHGPVSEAYVRQSVNDGSLDRQLSGCIKGEHTWQPLETILKPKPVAPPSDEAQTGLLFGGQGGTSTAYMDLSEAASVIPAEARAGAESSFKRNFQTHLPEDTPEIYGGFWMRLAAMLIDVVIVWVVVFAILMTVALMHAPASVEASRQPEQTLYPVMIGAVLFLLPLLYFSLFESSAKQATLGKLALGLRVTNDRGNRISFLCALGRNLGRILSGMIFYIGYMMAGWTSRKQALHDLMASTFVVRKSNLETWQEGNGAGTAASMPAWAIVLIVVLGSFFALVPILSAIAIPAYQNYLVRAQVSEAVVVSTDARRAVEKYVVSHGTTPADNEAAGIGSPDQIHGRYVSSVEVANGTVITSFGGQANRMLQNRHITFKPNVDGQIIQWRCSSEDIAVTYLPTACRDP